MPPITGALFTNTNTFYAAKFSLSLQGALYSNPNTFYNATLELSAASDTGGGISIITRRRRR